MVVFVRIYYHFAVGLKAQALVKSHSFRLFFIDDESYFFDISFRREGEDKFDQLFCDTSSAKSLVHGKTIYV